MRHQQLRFGILLSRNLHRLAQRRNPPRSQTIQSDAAESFPRAFKEPACTLVAIDSERTFWEKATILHQETFRTGPQPARYSRHYYDLHRLATSPVKELALADHPQNGPAQEPIVLSLFEPGRR